MGVLPGIKYRQMLFKLVGNFSSINYRITSLAPNPLIVIHHQTDNDRHHLPHNFSALGNLAGNKGPDTFI